MTIVRADECKVLGVLVIHEYIFSSGDFMHTMGMSFPNKVIFLTFSFWLADSLTPHTPIHALLPPT